MPSERPIATMIYGTVKLKSIHLWASSDCWDLVFDYGWFRPLLWSALLAVFQNAAELAVFHVIFFPAHMRPSVLFGWCYCCSTPFLWLVQPSSTPTFHSGSPTFWFDLIRVNPCFVFLSCFHSESDISFLWLICIRIYGQLLFINPCCSSAARRHFKFTKSPKSKQCSCGSLYYELGGGFYYLRYASVHKTRHYTMFSIWWL